MPAKTKEMHGLYSIAFTADFKRMFAHWEVVGVVRPRAFFSVKPKLREIF